jgi:hypothetical protein
MNTLSTFIDIAVARAKEYKNCSFEQALTYSCEDVVENEIGSRSLLSRFTTDWLEQVCAREDIDMPHVMVRRASPKSLASADIYSYTICIRGTNTTTATILHEIAHVSIGVESHEIMFRDELIRLARAHISVEYAALLHGVFTGVGLAMSPWPASTARK